MAPPKSPLVIVMTFWYVLMEWTYNFLNFFIILHLGLITTPHVLYVHMPYVLFLFSCFILHTITWPREVIIVLWSFIWLRSSTLWTHPHPHSLPLLPQPHHPCTPRLCRSTTAPPEEGCHLDARYDYPATPDCTREDSCRSRLGTAMVGWVLPSRKSAWLDTWCYQEPSLD